MLKGEDLMPKICPVNSNIDKQRTYKENCAKYKKAIQEGFCFEAMLIAYAMLEDRLRSFLYHIGALKTRQSKSISYGMTEQRLRNIVSLYKKDDKKEDDSLGITKISGKMKIIRCTLEWAATVDGGYEDDKYLLALKKQYEGNIDIKNMLDVLEDLSEWLDYRNEIMHALMNKNVESLQLTLKERTIQGMELARKIDGFVGQVKKRNSIRRSVNLKNNNY